MGVYAPYTPRPCRQPYSINTQGTQQVRPGYLRPGLLKSSVGLLNLPSLGALNDRPRLISPVAGAGAGTGAGAEGGGGRPLPSTARVARRSSASASRSLRVESSRVRPARSSSAWLGLGLGLG